MTGKDSGSMGGKSQKNELSPYSTRKRFGNAGKKRDKQHETDMLKVNPMRACPSEPYSPARVGVCVGSVIVDVDIGNTKCSCCRSTPMRRPNMNGLAFWWTIGFTHGLRVTVCNWSPPGREVLSWGHRGPP